jgi:hypothetical protein
MANEVQSTDLRNTGWIKKWDGKWIPKGDSKNYAVLRKAGEEFLREQRPQTVKEIRAAIEKALGEDK